MRQHGLAAGIAVGLTLVTAACGSQDGSTPRGDAVYLPSGSPSATIEMLDPPADYSMITGDGFTISAPSDFQQKRFKSSNGEPGLILEKPSGVAAVPERVAVIRDVDPKASAAEQSFTLETVKSVGGPGGEVSRVQLPAPEGQSAFLITWKELRPSKGAGNVEVTYWQLMQQVDQNLILNVVAFAPSDGFETSEVSKILRTFRPGSAA